ncbi:PP2C family protein-serine/threonine phosphatase [Actinoplanes sp. NEAU-A12]|uniref:PP2C family protein-serine/threonine phosphatase n=1 Tax=Actinoplanes sandaracinus TaxID=3045177 RepID=A0ABT6WZN4_9ACTN|nr:PP2C family protein-serine/threonine phosphatase [Actinoplanes sandaracinus]MDI6105213.1 PP2C family protein-serine/threonine phosphatase [Actinoplanes sandaracinus]
MTNNGGAAARELTPPDLLMAAYRTLGGTLNLHRNAAAAVRLAVPSLARVAVLVLAADRQQAQWWMAGHRPAAHPPDHESYGAVACLPSWIGRILADAIGVKAHPVPSGRRFLPDGTEHDGHGMVVTLSCAYQCQGVLVLLRDVRQETFADAHQSVAVEFAAAVSRAVTAAMLYRDQVQVADTLRAALMPTPLPYVAGIELAASYRPAREALRIGGDIVHVEPLAEGSALCVLGDVCGKGIDAAVAGNRLRQSLRVLHRVTRQPLDMLNLLNDATFDPDTAEATQFTTVIIGVVRAIPGGGALLRLAAGGHPAPLVVRRTGTVQRVHIGGMMLGAECPATFAEAVIWLAPGESCVLYTDGVIDAEGGPRGEAFGQNRLVALLAEYAGMPAALVAERIDQRTDDWLNRADHDDIAVLVLRAPQPFEASPH